MKKIVLQYSLLFGALPLLWFAFSHSLPPAPRDVSYFSFTSQRQPLKMAYRYKKSAHPNGSTVLLLHGKNFSAGYWNRVMEELQQEGYDVLAADQVGFGQSSLPSSYQYSFAQLAFNTKMLLDSLNISSVRVLGHSMGGMLAVRFALMYPATCRQLLLENPIGLEDTRAFVPYSSADEEFRRELSKTKEDLKAYMIENYFHNEWKEQYNELLEQSAAPLSKKGFRDHAWNMALTTDMIISQPVCYELDKIKVPTVLIIGQEDRTAIGKDRASSLVKEQLGNYKVLGGKAASVIPEAKLVKLEGVGHIPHVEAFRQFMDSLHVYLKQSSTAR